jgi:hypothetical protein
MDLERKSSHLPTRELYFKSIFNPRKEKIKDFSKLAVTIKARIWEWETQSIS